MSEQKKKTITVNKVKYEYAYTNRHGIDMYKVNNGFLSEERIRKHQKILVVDRTKLNLETAKKQIQKQKKEIIKNAADRETAEKIIKEREKQEKATCTENTQVEKDAE